MGGIKLEHINAALNVLNKLKPMQSAVFAIEEMNGKYRLVKRHATIGVMRISAFCNKRELYDIIEAIQGFILA